MSVEMKGIIPPVITPYHDDLTIDYKGFATVLEHLLASGVDGVIVGGTTGEYYLHTIEERLELIKVANQVVQGRIPLIAGVGGIQTGQCIDIGLRAKAIGVDAILISSPYYAVPTQKELANHAIQIDEAVSLPIMLYNYPGRTGTCMESEFFDIISNRPNFQAIKESSGRLDMVHMLAQQYPQLSLFCGADDQALEFFAWNARGWVCGAGTALPREHIALYESCVLNNDFNIGRQIMSAMLPFLEFLELHGKFTQSVKFACKYAGLPTGSVRPPLQPLSEQEQDSLTGLIAEMKSSIDRILSGQESRLSTPTLSVVR